MDISALKYVLFIVPMINSINVSDPSKPYSHDT